MRVFFLIAAIFVATVCAEDEEVLPPLEGMQSLRIFCNNVEQLTIVRSYEGVPGFEYLKTTEHFVDVLVTADKVTSFKKRLEASHIRYVVTVQDIQEKVIEEYIAQQVERRSPANYNADYPFGKLSFTYYPQYDEINNYLEYISDAYSDVATPITIGTSYEGREIRGLKLSSSGKNNPAIFIDAGIHAREWIAPVTALYIIDQIVGNQTNRHLLENIDWYIIPLLNPDGYQFTHAKGANRLWRKTRSINRGSSCRGVDGNRNFDMSWMTIGASSYPCSETYAGPQPFSEPETQSVKDFILKQNGNVKMYLTLHSYGQYILYPWGYTTALPANEPELKSLARACAAAIQSVRKTRYTFGTSANHLYPSSGGSDDWAMAKGGVDLAYTYELPGGYSGFLLPPSQIKPVGIETFEAMRVIGAYAAKKYA